MVILARALCYTGADSQTDNLVREMSPASASGIQVSAPAREEDLPTMFRDYRNSP